MAKQQQQWHTADGSEPLPNVFNRFKSEVSNAHRSHTDHQAGVEVRIEPGAGTYEEEFKFYWMIVLWVLLGYHATAMIILLVHMAWTGSIYLWIPHLIGTAIILPALGFTACVYRFILFPSPGYYSKAPQYMQPVAYEPVPPTYGDTGGSGVGTQPRVHEGAAA